MNEWTNGQELKYHRNTWLKKECQKLPKIFCARKYLPYLFQRPPRASDETEMWEFSIHCTVAYRWFFIKSIGDYSWRRKWQPTPVFFLGKSLGQRSLTGYSPQGKERVGRNLAANQQGDYCFLFFFLLSFPFVPVASGTIHAYPNWEKRYRVGPGQPPRAKTKSDKKDCRMQHPLQPRGGAPPQFLDWLLWKQRHLPG